MSKMIICLLIALLFLSTDSSSIRSRNHKNDLVPFMSSRLDLMKKDPHSMKIVSKEPFIIQLQMPSSKEMETKAAKEKDKKRKRPAKKRVSKIKSLRKKQRRRRDLLTLKTKPREEKLIRFEIPRAAKEAESQLRNITKDSVNRMEILKALSYPKRTERTEIKRSKLEGIKNIKNQEKINHGKLTKNSSNRNLHKHHLPLSDRTKISYPSTPKLDRNSQKYSYKDLMADRERLEKKIKYIKNMLNANDSNTDDAIRVRRRSDSDRTANKIAKMFLTLSAVNGLHDKRKTKCNDDDDDDDDRVEDIWEKERRNNPLRKSSSSNEERYKVKKWIEFMKNKRSSGKTCPCMGNVYGEEGDVFPLEQKLPKGYFLMERGRSSEESSELYGDPSYYSRGKINKNDVKKRLPKSQEQDGKIKAMSKNGNKKLEVPFEDLELYRSRARQILQNAEEILDKIKEEEEKRLAAPSILMSQLKELTSRIHGDPRNNENDLIRKIQKNLGWGPLAKPQDNADGTFLDNVKSFILDPYEKAKALTDESTKKLSSYLLRNLGRLQESSEEQETRNANDRTDDETLKIYFGKVLPNEEKPSSANLAKEESQIDDFSKNRENSLNMKDILSAIPGESGNEKKELPEEKQEKFNNYKDQGDKETVNTNNKESSETLSLEKEIVAKSKPESAPQEEKVAIKLNEKETYENKEEKDEKGIKSTEDPAATLEKSGTDSDIVKNQPFREIERTLKRKEKQANVAPSRDLQEEEEFEKEIEKIVKSINDKEGSTADDEVIQNSGIERSEEKISGKDTVAKAFEKQEEESQKEGNNIVASASPEREDITSKESQKDSTTDVRAGEKSDLSSSLSVSLINEASPNDSGIDTQNTNEQILKETVKANHEEDEMKSKEIFLEEKPKLESKKIEDESKVEENKSTLENYGEDVVSETKNISGELLRENEKEDSVNYRSNLENDKAKSMPEYADLVKEAKTNSKEFSEINPNESKLEGEDQSLENLKPGSNGKEEISKPDYTKNESEEDQRKENLDGDTLKAMSDNKGNPENMEEEKIETNLREGLTEDLNTPLKQQLKNLENFKKALYKGSSEVNKENDLVKKTETENQKTETVKNADEGTERDISDEIVKGKNDKIVEDYSEETVKGINEKTVGDNSEETARGTNEETVGDHSEETMRGNSQETVKGTNEKTVGDNSEETVRGTNEETVKGTNEKTVKDNSEEPVKGTNEETVEDNGEETVKGTNEETVKGINEKTVGDNSEETMRGTNEEIVGDRSEETVKGISEKTVGDNSEETVRSTNEETVGDRSEETMRGISQEIVKGTNEKTVKDNSEETVKDNSEETVKGTNEETVKDNSEEPVKGTNEETVEDNDEETVKGTNEETVRGINEKTVGDNSEETMRGTNEEIVGDRSEETVKGISEKTVGDNSEETVRGTNKKTVEDKSQDTVEDNREETVRGTNEETVKDNSEETVRGTNEETVKDNSEETVKGISEKTVGDNSEETVRGTNKKTVEDKSQDTVEDNREETVRGTNEETVKDNSEETVKGTNEETVEDNGEETVRGTNEGIISDETVDNSKKKLQKISGGINSPETSDFSDEKITEDKDDQLVDKNVENTEALLKESNPHEVLKSINEKGDKTLLRPFVSNEKSSDSESADETGEYKSSEIANEYLDKEGSNETNLKANLAKHKNFEEDDEITLKTKSLDRNEKDEEFKSLEENQEVFDSAKSTEIVESQNENKENDDKRSNETVEVQDNLSKQDGEAMIGKENLSNENLKEKDVETLVKAKNSDKNLNVGVKETSQELLETLSNEKMDNLKERNSYETSRETSPDENVQSEKPENSNEKSNYETLEAIPVNLNQESGQMDKDEMDQDNLQSNKPEENGNVEEMTGNETKENLKETPDEETLKAIKMDDVSHQSQEKSNMKGSFENQDNDDELTRESALKENIEEPQEKQDILKENDDVGSVFDDQKQRTDESELNTNEDKNAKIEEVPDDEKLLLKAEDLEEYVNNQSKQDSSEEDILKAVSNERDEDNSEENYESLQMGNPEDYQERENDDETDFRSASLEDELDNKIEYETPLKSAQFMEETDGAESNKYANEVESEETLRAENDPNHLTNIIDQENKSEDILKSVNFDDESFEDLDDDNYDMIRGENLEPESLLKASVQQGENSQENFQGKGQITLLGDFQKPDSISNPLKASKLKVPEWIGKIMKDLNGKEKSDITSIKNLNPDKIDHMLDKIGEAEQKNLLESEEVDCRKQCACAEEMNIRSRNIGRYEIVKDFLHWMKDLQLNRVISDD